MSFRELNVGKFLSQSKVRTEYHLIINNYHEVTVEIVNSRFSRKKRILFNGEIMERERKSVNNLNYTWTYPVDDVHVVFSLTPNAGCSGTDLRVNGKDFFEYVYQVESRALPAATRKKRSETLLLFRVPHDVPDVGSPPCSPKRLTSRDLSRMQPGQIKDKHREVDTSAEYASLDESGVSAD